jgi:hypothetical protein
MLNLFRPNICLEFCFQTFVTSTYGRDEKCIQKIIRKFERKISLGRPRLSCEDNMRVDVMEIGWKVVDWMHLVHDRDWWCAVVNTVKNLQVP